MGSVPALRRKPVIESSGYIFLLSRYSTSSNCRSSLQLSRVQQGQLGSYVFKWAELPARTDVYTYDGTTRWGNHDLYPIPKKERTYGFLGFYSYYLVSGISITGFSKRSAYVSAGLSAQETIRAVLVGCVCAALNACLGVQEIHHTPACRVGNFFAGVGLLTSLIYINIVQNTLSFGMDFAGVIPK